MNQMSKSRIASLFVVLLKTARVLVAVVIVGAACLFTASLFANLSTAQLSLPVSFHAEGQALRVSVTHAGGGLHQEQPRIARLQRGASSLLRADLEHAHVGFVQQALWLHAIRGADPEHRLGSGG